MDENLDLSKNIEINEALKEFEATSAPVQGNRIESSAGVKEDTEQPKIIGFVMKISGGLIKDQKQANYFLLGFVALAIIISLFLIFSRNTGRKEPTLYQEDLTPTARETIPQEILNTIPHKYGK